MIWKLIRQLLSVLTLMMIVGCSSSPSSSMSYYYTDSWWYDDYWFYQDYVYPDCCHNEGEFKQAVTNWWHTLDPDKQAEIKDKVKNWQEGDGPDISALKNDFQTKFDSLSPQQQQTITEKRESIRQQMSENPKVLETATNNETHSPLTTEQKQQLKNRWQSADRPTLQRPTTRPAVRPTINRPSFGGGGFGGRMGGRR